MQEKQRLLQERISKWIKKMRVFDCEMTQEELAYELGITQPVLSSWENGKSIPSLITLLHICELAGEEMGDILR